MWEMCEKFKLVNETLSIQVINLLTSVSITDYVGYAKLSAHSWAKCAATSAIEVKPGLLPTGAVGTTITLKNVFMDLGEF